MKELNLHNVIKLVSKRRQSVGCKGIRDRTVKLQQRPLVYILVLCHNGRKWLETCLSSLADTQYPNYRIVLIDNGSEDGSIDLVKENYPEVEVVENRKNLGWCEGNNIGVRKALNEGADHVVLLNSDIKAEQAMWLENLVSFAENNPRYGIVGCIQYN